jgi:hypothetical protein
MNTRLSAVRTVALHPVPELDEIDTGLRFTDILFGFVMRELFIRLQNWTLLTDAVRLHLIVGATLVLGSWIGFRNSLYRSSYELKFFNLPLFRFIVDQLMLILYFRVAVLTPAPDVNKSLLPPCELAKETTRLVVYVFMLYVVWDLLTIWMARARGTTPNGQSSTLYPDVSPSKRLPPNWGWFQITVVFLALFLVILWFSGRLTPRFIFLTTTAVLLVYRWTKETGTSWQLLHPA